MTRPTDDLHQPPDDGIWPGDEAWLQWHPPTVSDDFVDRTTAAVRADQHDRRDRDRTLHALLARWKTPEPSADFVQRTLTALAEDQQDLHHALPSYHTPDPSPDFVDRTLAAVLAERACDRLHPVPTHRNPWWLVLPLAAAAVLLILYTFDSRPPSPAEDDHRFARVTTTPDIPTPAPWTTAMARHLDDRAGRDPITLSEDPWTLLADGALDE